MCGDTGEVDLTGGQFNEEQDVDPFQYDGVDGEEVTGQDCVRLRGQELLPGGSGPAGRRVDPGLVQDLPDRAGRDLIAQAGQLALGAAMPVGLVNPDSVAVTCGLCAVQGM